MSEEIANLYEGMYIVNAALTDAARAQVLEKIEAMIKEHGGEVHKCLEMGRRRLAFEMGRHKEGYYYVLYFTVEPKAIKPMWNEYKLMEDLVRFMTLRTEKMLDSLEFKLLEQPVTK